MMQNAYFDADGICTVVADMEMTTPDGGSCKLVPRGTKASDIWLNGASIAPCRACDLVLPALLEQAQSDYTLTLPAGAVAIVDGVKQKGALVLSRRDERDYHIVIRGKMTGDYIVKVEGYATQRRQAYPPVGDQLAALWDGYDALYQAVPRPDGGNEAAAMRAKIAEVKSSIPSGATAPQPDLATVEQRLIAKLKAEAERRKMLAFSSGFSKSQEYVQKGKEVVASAALTAAVLNALTAASAAAQYPMAQAERTLTGEALATILARYRSGKAASDAELARLSAIEWKAAQAIRAATTAAAKQAAYAAIVWG